MPKSKRAKLVSLTKVSKKTKEQKGALITEVQKSTEKWKYCWLFEVGAMRNAHLKTVRNLWKDSARIFLGRSAVMAKALGSSVEQEHRDGLHKLSKQIKGQVGLFFTDTEPQEVIEWFDDFRQPDFARAGNLASRTVILPAGPVMRTHSDPPEPFPHNEEPQLRKLGLTTTMNRGVPTLGAPHKLCEKGKTLTSEQAQLLKLIGERMVVFRVQMKARWDATTGEVVQIEGAELAPEEAINSELVDEEEEDGMDELPRRVCQSKKFLRRLTVDACSSRNHFTSCACASVVDMRLPISLLGLSTQFPIFSKQVTYPSAPMSKTTTFSFKEGSDVFTPKDLVGLARPGSGVANAAGDLVLVPVSKYNFEEKKNQKSIWIASLQSNSGPLEIPLAKGGEAFWLDSRTVAHAVRNEETDKLELYAVKVNYETQFAAPGPPVLIATFPTATPTNFKYAAGSGKLVFSDYVYPDGNLTTVKAHDDEWETRGNSALVYDSGFERHWDTWVLPKKPSLFSVPLTLTEDRQWSLVEEFTNILADTKHAAPVEPFGGLDNFDVLDDRVIYTAKDPKLPEALHTKQNVYIININGGSPKELTSGTHGATTSPVFSPAGDRVAWLEMAKDGYEADRNQIIIYDLKQDIKFSITPTWDRSPGSLAFSTKGDHIYFTAGDVARVKIFVLPVPPTPKESTDNPGLPSFYTTPVELVGSAASSDIQPLGDNRLLFTQSSFTSPNDVFVLEGLKALEAELDGTREASFKGSVKQVTKFTEEALKGKQLAEGEDFWFKGAEGKDVQGFILKPKGWKQGENKKWPVLLLIHGGPQSAWEDQWSNRWNPNVFAQQGYFTVAINPTGSSTFGQEFTDAIAEDWGGKPFIDLRAGWQHVLDNYPEGHPEYGFGFKALFCHDGFNHDFGGRPYDEKAKAIIDKFSPSNYVSRWSTPQLIVHGSKDYRLAETEGIGAFHALQQRGVPTRLVIFPDENHWVLNHGNSLKWHYEVFRWFDQFV
ncbi:hypothetical protein HWV62_37978 [Athelia sp. TMB]|nr:hypothetical protein HWV62_37978 [Athelia sp. TMB]